MKRIVGIDPGTKGAVAVVEGRNVVDVMDMPIIDTKGKLRYVDGLALLHFIRSASPDLVVCEQVASRPARVKGRPSQGIATSFAFGVMFGGALSAALASEAELLLVVPQVWKRRFHLIGTTKEASRLMALQMFPDASHWLQRKKDVDRAEAMLIATYGWAGTRKA